MPHGLRWKGPFKSHPVQPLPWQGHFPLDQVPPIPIQAGLKASSFGYRNCSLRLPTSSLTVELNNKDLFGLNNKDLFDVAMLVNAFTNGQHDGTCRLHLQESWRLHKFRMNWPRGWLLLRGNQRGLRNRQKDEEERDVQKERRGVIPCTKAGWESAAGKQLYGEGPKALGGHKVGPEPAKCPCSNEIQKQHRLHEEEPWQHVKGGDNSSLSALECLLQCWAAESMNTVGSVRSHRDY